MVALQVSAWGAPSGSFTLNRSDIMQHGCPKCDGPTYPRTAPVGNTAVHDRTCRNCGLIYTFDPANVDTVKSGQDFHLKALKETKKKGKK